MMTFVRKFRPMHTRISLALMLALALTGCDQINQKLGLEDPGKKDARLEAEGKAVGSACRQSGRAIEDCYAIYTWVPKAGVFEGWREMDGYMRENKIDTIVPQLPHQPGSQKKESHRRRRSGCKPLKKRKLPQNTDSTPGNRHKRSAAR
jgi:hypothetical protein